MQWYYTIKRERQGPVDETTIKSLITSGELKQTDLVWNASMGDTWKTVGEIFRDLLADNSPNGTGGQTTNTQITSDACTALSGQWGLAIGGMILYMFFACTSIGLASLLPIAGPFAQLLVAPPFVLGLMIFFLQITRRQHPEISHLFAGFHQFWPAVGAYFFSTLFAFLWMIPGVILLSIGAICTPNTEFSQNLSINFPETIGPALLVAGVILTILSAVIIGLRYSQIYFVLADDPSAGCFDAIRASIALMSGNKWKLFCLGLRFIGWLLLATLTFGIGFIWLYPYMMAAYACFYDDLKPERS